MQLQTEPDVVISLNKDLSKIAGPLAYNVINRQAYSINSYGLMHGNMTAVLIMDDHIRHLRWRLEEHTARVRRRRIEQRALLLRFMKERRRAERHRQRRRRLSLTY